jgi:hypothetical protein
MLQELIAPPFTLLWVGSSLVIEPWSVTTPGVQVGVAEGVPVGVSVAVGDAVGVGVGVPATLQKSSIDPKGVTVLSYPPASQMRLIPSVSVGKLRRAMVNAPTGEPIVHVFVPG